MTQVVKSFSSKSGDKPMAARSRSRSRSRRSMQNSPSKLSRRSQKSKIESSISSIWDFDVIISESDNNNRDQAKILIAINSPWTLEVSLTSLLFKFLSVKPSLLVLSWIDAMSQKSEFSKNWNQIKVENPKGYINLHNLISESLLMSNKISQSV